MFHPMCRAGLRFLTLALIGAGAWGCAGGAPTAEKSEAPKGYAFWPPFPDAPRMQFVAAFNSSQDVEPVKISGLERLVFGEESNQPGVIQKPYGLAIKNGRIYVTDIRGKALVVLDLRKKQTRLVGVTGFNKLENPVAVAVADDGMIYVADSGRGAVFVYDSRERYAQVFGFQGFEPVAVAVHGDRLYAADKAGQKVVSFNRRTGERLGEFGTVGDEDGQFRVPIGLATDQAGNVYVMDMMRYRLQKFTPEGEFISAMGTQGDYMSSFARPKHITVDNDGYIYVVDAIFDNVQMFDDQYRMLMHFGSAGSFPGSMDLPVGVATCDDSLDVFEKYLHPGFKPRRVVAVTNQFGPAKVNVYVLGETREGYTAQQLAAAAVPVSAGTGLPSAEQLQLQSPVGLEEPPAEGEAPPEGEDEGAAPPEPAPPPAREGPR